MKKILIIEDNLSIAGAMKELLTITGHLVIVAKNGLEALDLLSTMDELPSLIILDIVMPVMNGSEFRKAQLENPKLAEIPVIIITGNNNFNELKEKLQAYEFLNKPVDTKDLLYIVENFFYLNLRKTTYASLT